MKAGAFVHVSRVGNVTRALAEDHGVTKITVRQTATYGIDESWYVTTQFAVMSPHETQAAVIERVKLLLDGGHTFRIITPKQ